MGIDSIKSLILGSAFGGAGYILEICVLVTKYISNYDISLYSNV
jgi:hypothetical protein